MKYHFILVSVLALLIGGCKDPQQEYFKQIENSGYIPFKQPMSNVRTGSILRGKPNQLIPMGPPTSCFPDKIGGDETGLRWESDAALAQTHFQSRLAFNAKINTIANVGTPTIQFKFDFTHVTNIDFEVEGVTAELIDQFALAEFYQQEMSSQCKEILMKTPFIASALQVKKMSFVFLDVTDGKIFLDMDKIEQLVDIEVGVTWHIENGYKLVITTPKFVGYQLAQLRIADNGMINLMSYQADFKANQFLWVEL